MRITNTTKQSLKQIPAGMWMLGSVSLLMDVSSAVIYSLLSLFMVTTLGVAAMAAGKGLAEATALIVKVFSDPLTDSLGRRKGQAVFGYALGVLTKWIFQPGERTCHVAGELNGLGASGTFWPLLHLFHRGALLPGGAWWSGNNTLLHWIASVQGRDEEFLPNSCLPVE